MKLNMLVLASLILGVSATAAPTPITQSQLGPATVTFSSDTSLSSNPSPGHFGYAFPYLVCPPEVGGCGGAFRADIQGNDSGLTVHDATVWCVDAQLDVSPGSMYYANIVRLNNTPALDDATATRYGADGVSPLWVNPISFPGFVDDSASRYRLVAALVMQFQDSSFSGDYSKPYDSTFNADLSGATAVALTARNEAIQRAIWWIMYNSVNGAPDPANINGSRSAGVDAEYSDWVDYALRNVGSLDLSHWAVVSGPADSVTGALLPPSNGHYQTFLVQLAPEPEYLALLGAGLGAIVWLKRRQRA